jgi:hypothetical protein
VTNRILSALAVMSVLLAGRGASAQLIPVKTIPVAESEQFSFFPTAGRTGLSLTLADTLMDPFRNPARGSRLARSQYFGAPSFFTVSDNAGGGTTFPMGMFLRRGNTFGGFAAAFQEIERGGEQFFGGPVFTSSFAGPIDDGQPFVEQPRSHHNNYAFALLGRALDSGRTSVAFSVLWSGLKSLDGVDAFYFGNTSLVQLGDAIDMRLGVTKEFRSGRSIEAIALRSQFAMSHEVGFTDFIWDPGLRRPVTQRRLQHNDDRADVWGVHLEFEQPLDTGWRVGALLTGNLIDQPTIPNYELTSGMGREGDAVAANVGIGVGRTVGLVSFGLDAIYEPIISHTWVPDSLDNDFRFNNAKLRGGVSKDFKLLLPGNFVRMHFNTEYHWINYRMEQENILGNLVRTRRESWMERGRGGGISFITPTLQLHYQVQSKSGVGRPGVISSNGGDVAVPELSIAPWMPPLTSTTLGAVNVTRHQFSVSVPVR